MVDIRDLNITIVGLGLIGGTYAQAIKKLNPKNLWAVDIDKDSLVFAEEEKIIDQGFTDTKEPLKNSDLVIMAVYPELTKKFIEDNMDNFKAGAIITDSAGIKEDLIDQIHSKLRDDLDFIGGHPMAGSEESGVRAASAEIFKDANYIITPVDKNKAENIDIIEDLARKIGFKTVVKIDPRKHDEIIAYTSQLPHIIAITLMNCNHIDNVNSFTGGSFNDVTRIAKINPSLWSELMIENSEHMINQIDLFQDYMSNIKTAIKDGDYHGLNGILKESNRRKEEQSKHV